MPRTYSQLKQEMIENVRKGKYLLGELIEPKSYKKFIIDKDGMITESMYTVSGRKIPINAIRLEHMKTILSYVSWEIMIVKHWIETSSFGETMPPFWAQDSSYTQQK